MNALARCFKTLLVLVFGWVPIHAQAQALLGARWSADFADSVGVNTHFIWSDTYYATHFPEVKARLLDLGIRHIRDVAIAGAGDVQPADQSERFRDLGRAGIRGEFIFDLGTSRKFVQTFPRGVAPMFEAYELPNEFNINGGKDWATKLGMWIGTFQGYVRSVPAPHFPIIGPSLVVTSPDPFVILGDRRDDFDFGNVHAYFDAFNPGTSGWGDRASPPCQAFHYGAIAFDACLAAKVSGQRPMMVTETGWSSDLNDSGGVPPALQAKYLARALLLQFNRGVRRTYIYQLLDAGVDDGKHDGLLTADAQEKPSFRELRALLQLVDDHERKGSAGSLPIRFNGQTTDVEKTLLRRSDGSFRLILWVEQPGLDPTFQGSDHRAVAVLPQTITLTLTGHTPQEIVRFSDGGDVAKERLEPSKSGADTCVLLTLTDNLTVVDIGPL